MWQPSAGNAKAAPATSILNARQAPRKRTAAKLATQPAGQCRRWRTSSLPNPFWRAQHGSLLCLYRRPDFYGKCSSLGAAAQAIVPSCTRSFALQPGAIAAAVVLLHVGGLAALEGGLLRRAADSVVPVQMLSELIEPPQPVAQAPAPPLAPLPKPALALPPKVTPKAPKPLPPAPPAPRPLAVKDTAPSPAAPLGTTTPAPPAPPIEVAQTPAAPAMPPAPPAPPAPATVQLPSSDADYLNNPPPAYPPVSKRMGETGKVVVRVYISPDGRAQKGEVRTSSGFERLDDAALAAALKWRYVPGKRGGAPEAMWVNVPINFTLN